MAYGRVGDVMGRYHYGDVGEVGRLRRHVLAARGAKVHGDLNPSNVFVSDRGVTLIDNNGVQVDSDEARVGEEIRPSTAAPELSHLWMLFKNEEFQKLGADYTSTGGDTRALINELSALKALIDNYTARTPASVVSHLISQDIKKKIEDLKESFDEGAGGAQGEVDALFKALLPPKKK